MHRKLLELSSALVIAGDAGDFERPTAPNPDSYRGVRYLNTKREPRNTKR